MWPRLAALRLRGVWAAVESTRERRRSEESPGLEPNNGDDDGALPLLPPLHDHHHHHRHRHLLHLFLPLLLLLLLLYLTRGCLPRRLLWPEGRIRRKQRVSRGTSIRSDGSERGDPPRGSACRADDDDDGELPFHHQPQHHHHHHH